MRAAVLFACLFVSTLVAPLAAQIQVEPNYPAYSLIEITYDDASQKPDAWRSLIWDVELLKATATKSTSKPSLKQTASGDLILTGPPGKYRVRCSIVVGELHEGKVTIDPATAHRTDAAEFTIGDESSPDVEPKPDDENDNEDNPAPIAEGAWVIIVEQTEHRDVATAKIFNAADYWKSVRDRGLYWRWYDYDAADAARYRAAADAVGLPAMLIFDRGGKLLKSAALPKTLDDVEAMVAKTTGRPRSK